MLPVFRVSEGAMNLDQNYTTFDDCVNIFKKNGIVLIFSEGGCTNEWHLRSLKKGTARLAVSAWQQGIPLKVLPLGINYSSFRKFGKIVHLNFGRVISEEHIFSPLNSGMAMVSFNKLLELELKDLVYEIEENDKKLARKYFEFPIPAWQKTLLFIPAGIGYLVHFPLHAIVKSIIHRNPNDHYDSIMVGLLFFLYPLQLLLIAFIVYRLCGPYYMLVAMLFIPFTAWSFIRLKKMIN